MKETNRSKIMFLLSRHSKAFINHFFVFKFISLFLFIYNHKQRLLFASILLSIVHTDEKYIFFFQQLFELRNFICNVIKTNRLNVNDAKRTNTDQLMEQFRVFPFPNQFGVVCSLCCIVTGNEN